MTENDKSRQEVSVYSELLCREWVEVREENIENRIVLKPAASNIPPARGRHGLDLSIPCKALAQSPGSDDRMVGKPGVWSLTHGLLFLRAPGWDGEYQIEELTMERLVIKLKE